MRYAASTDSVSIQCGFSAAIAMDVPKSSAEPIRPGRHDSAAHADHAAGVPTESVA
jgi:hypothetical protein